MCTAITILLKYIHRLLNYRIGKVYFLEYTDNLQVFFTAHHIGYCCTNVTQGHCWATVCSNNDLWSFLHWYCSQDGGSTGVSRRGGQGRWEVARGATIAGDQVPTKQASWWRAWAMKCQELGKKKILAGIRHGRHYLRVSSGGAVPCIFTPISLRFNSILSSHLRLGLHVSSPLEVSRCMYFSSQRVHYVSCRSHPPWFNNLNMKSTNYAALQCDVFSSLLLLPLS
jgi:hypothetical protein